MLTKTMLTKIVSGIVISAVLFVSGVHDAVALKSPMNEKGSSYYTQEEYDQLINDTLHLFPQWVQDRATIIYTNEISEDANATVTCIPNKIIGDYKATRGCTIKIRPYDHPTWWHANVDIVIAHELGHIMLSNIFFMDTFNECGVSDYAEENDDERGAEAVALYIFGGLNFRMKAISDPCFNRQYTYIKGSFDYKEFNSFIFDSSESITYGSSISW